MTKFPKVAWRVSQEMRVMVLVWLALSLVRAQTVTAPVVVSDSTQIWTGNLGSEPVGAGDLVFLSVTGSPELSRSYRIGSDGQIALPMLAEGVPVAGMRPAQLAAAVADQLVKKHLLVNPVVSAEVLEYRSRLVTVTGAVKSPATVQALGEMRLLDAIAKAQGLAPEAGPEILVTRPGSETERIAVKALFNGNDSSLNIRLHGGEQIRVPEAPKLYVVGNVRMPGAYPMTELDGSSVLKALAISQGTQPFTAKMAYVYRLVAKTNERREIPIELDRILHRKAPDVALEANDILYIPDNSRKRMGASVLDHITGVSGSAASSLIIRY